ncbi:MAG: DUF7544 domain-containing protein [Candidatus Moraniibacteriota bacterium]
MNKKIDYFSIIKEAIEITKNNRVLWWFGFLSIFAGMGSSFNSNFSGNSSDKNSLDEMEYASLFRKVSFYWENYAEWIILGIILIMVVCVGLFIIGLIGKSALIDSIVKVIRNEQVTFVDGFKRGVSFLKRMFLMSLLSVVTFLIFIFLVIFPVVRLFILKSYGIAIFLGLVGLMLILFVSILYFYLLRYAQIYLISSNLGVVESIKLAYRLFEKNMKESLIMGLVMIAVSFVLGIGIFLIVLAIFIPGGILGVLVYKTMSDLALIVLGILAGLLILGIFIFISSVLNVFSQTVWILFFNQIAKQEEKRDGLETEKEATKIIEGTEVEPNIS